MDKEYIEREKVMDALIINTSIVGNKLKEAVNAICAIPAADVRPVVVCAECQHNNACLTQAFVDDCGKMPLDRSTFFCADGERESNA